MRVKCLTQKHEHNVLGQGSNPDRSILDEHTNLEANASPQGLTDSALFMNLIKSVKMNLTIMYCEIYSILKDEFCTRLENIVPTFKQLSSLQANRELMTPANHYVKILN